MEERVSKMVQFLTHGQDRDCILTEAKESVSLWGCKLLERWDSGCCVTIVRKFAFYQVSNIANQRNWSLQCPRWGWVFGRWCLSWHWIACNQNTGDIQMYHSHLISNKKTDVGCSTVY